MNLFFAPRLSRRLVLALLLFLSLVSVPSLGIAQMDADQTADEVLRESPAMEENVPAAVDVLESSSKINLLQLIWTARWLMLPIILASVIVVAMGCERAVALRKARILPGHVVEMVRTSTRPGASFSPRKMYKYCSQYPSPLSACVQAVLLKLGRSSSEVERFASETMQREMERLFRNVQWLTLAAAVTPLIGLLGTVWGMIEAFYATANLPVGANKAEHLAEGIYTALITTAGGLIVAIPAAVLAHVFQAQIERCFLDIHELIYTRMLPQAERLEGRKTLARDSLDGTNPTHVTSENRDPALGDVETSVPVPPPAPQGNGSKVASGVPPVQTSRS